MTENKNKIINYKKLPRKLGKNKRKMSQSFCSKRKKIFLTPYCFWQMPYKKFMIKIRIDYVLSLIKSISLFKVFLLRGINQNNGLASFDDIHSSSLTDGTFQSKSDFLGCLSFFSENRLSLTTETSLFHVISSST